MIIESSDQVSRVSWLKRFPIPRNFKVAPVGPVLDDEARALCLC